ncbi:MAG: hypothetical protein FWG66_00560 [Spirochaetes bacterium]|nr:hypothetical protein [Spirochaetota bacterium]
MSNNQKNAIAFVSKIPEFQRNLALLQDFLGSIENHQLKALLNFLSKTELLFTEQSVAGTYSIKTGIAFDKMTAAGISSLIKDIEEGKYGL